MTEDNLKKLRQHHHVTIGLFVAFWLFSFLRSPKEFRIVYSALFLEQHLYCVFFNLENVVQIAEPISAGRCDWAYQRIATNAELNFDRVQIGKISKSYNAGSGSAQYACQCSRMALVTEHSYQTVASKLPGRSFSVSFSTSYKQENA